MLLPSKDTTLQGIVQLLIQFRTATGLDSATLKYTVFGCSEGRFALSMLPTRLTQSL